MKINTIRESCRRFYVTAIKEMHSRFNFDDAAYSISDMLLPLNARYLKPASLVNLFTRFPSLKTKCDTTKAEAEWRSHALIPPVCFGCVSVVEVTRLTVLEYWKVVCNIELEGTNVL